MVDTEDVQQYGTKFQNQLGKLADSDIPEADRTAIKACIDELRAQDEIGKGTLVGHLNRLRLSAERSDTPLVKMDDTDYKAFLTTLETDYGLSQGTRRNYRKALKKLMEYRDVSWLDEITIGVSPDRTVDPNELLRMDEINAMIDAANHTRDKALLATIADSGMRISAVTSLRKRDFEQRPAEGGVVYPNTDAPVKGATDPIPLTWSAGYVANWLDVHPRDDPDAALFHKLEHVQDGEDGALTYQYAARRIKRIAEQADVDPDRVQTHTFRKSAISRWIREGLPEQVIKHRASWVEDSGQFEIYSGVTSEELNEQVFEHYGLESSEPARPDLESCPTCSTPLRDGAKFCPSCGTALTQGARAQISESRGNASDTVAEAASKGDVEGATVGQEIDEALEGYPEAREAVERRFSE